MSPCYCSCCFQQGLSGGQFLREKRQASIPPSRPRPIQGKQGSHFRVKGQNMQHPQPLPGSFSLSGEATHKTGCLPSRGRPAIEYGNRSLMWYAGRRKGGGKGGGNEGCWEHQGSEWTQKGGSSPGQAWSQCETSKCRCLREELSGIRSTEALRLQWPRCARKGCSQEGENQRWGPEATHPKTAILLLLPFSLLFLFILHFCLVWVKSEDNWREPVLCFHRV